jgi:hypothetical protein
MKNAAVWIGNIPFLAQIGQTLVISAVLIPFNAAATQSATIRNEQSSTNSVFGL